MLKLAQALVFVGGNNNDGRLAVLGHGLRLPARGFDNLAESVLGVLD
jgi:hypothetical protein